MSLSLDIVKYNADLLFNDLVERKLDTNSNLTKMIDKDRNLTVDSEGRLSTISCFNLIGRLIKWFSNLDGSVDKQVNETVLKTLEAINEHNLRHNGDKTNMIYLEFREPDDVYVNNAKFFCFFDATRAYSDSYPADYLESILSCSIFQDNIGNIKNLISKIKANNYPKASDDYSTQTDDKRVWDSPLRV